MNEGDEIVSDACVKKHPMDLKQDEKNPEMYWSETLEGKTLSEYNRRWKKKGVCLFFNNELLVKGCIMKDNIPVRSLFEIHGSLAELYDEDNRLYYIGEYIVTSDWQVLANGMGRELNEKGDVIFVGQYKNGSRTLKGSGKRYWNSIPKDVRYFLLIVMCIIGIVVGYFLVRFIMIVYESFTGRVHINDCLGFLFIAPWMQRRVTSLSISDGVCSRVGWIQSFETNNYLLLKYLKIGNNSFTRVKNMDIRSLPLVENIIIGNDSFTRVKNMNVQSLPLLEDIIIGNNCFIQVANIDFQSLPLLKNIIIGDYCFTRVKNMDVQSLPSLEKIIIGDYCFSSLQKDKSMSIVNCSRLQDVKIGDYSASMFNTLHMEQLPSLLTLEFGRRTFIEVSLELNSENRW